MPPHKFIKAKFSTTHIFPKYLDLIPSFLRTSILPAADFFLRPNRCGNTPQPESRLPYYCCLLPASTNKMPFGNPAVHPCHNNNFPPSGAATKNSPAPQLFDTTGKPVYNPHLHLGQTRNKSQQHIAPTHAPDLRLCSSNQTP